MLTITQNVISNPFRNWFSRGFSSGTALAQSSEVYAHQDAAQKIFGKTLRHARRLLCASVRGATVKPGHHELGICLYVSMFHNDIRMRIIFVTFRNEKWQQCTVVSCRDVRYVCRCVADLYICYVDRVLLQLLTTICFKAYLIRKAQVFSCRSII